jgi:hypothetical protein
MMYSQQEYDMMRRQTLQIEAEKRFALAHIVNWSRCSPDRYAHAAGYVFRRYSQSSTLISAAEAKPLRLKPIAGMFQ